MQWPFKDYTFRWILFVFGIMIDIGSFFFQQYHPTGNDLKVKVTDFKYHSCEMLPWGQVLELCMFM